MVVIVEQHLEGPVTKQVLLDFSLQEVVVKQKVEATQAKLEAFEVDFPRLY